MPASAAALSRRDEEGRPGCRGSAHQRGGWVSPVVGAAFSRRDEEDHPGRPDGAPCVLEEVPAFLLAPLTESVGTCAANVCFVPNACDAAGVGAACAHRQCVADTYEWFDFRCTAYAERPGRCVAPAGDAHRRCVDAADCRALASGAACQAWALERDAPTMLLTIRTSTS